MKYLFILFSLFIFNTSFATTYYFSSVSGNDKHSSKQAQDPATPWKSIEKLNLIFSSLQPGDSILFKCGDTFYGSIVVAQSGIKSRPIVLSSYGSGAKPIITGLSTVKNWKSIGNGIFESTLETPPATSLNIVLFNNKLQPIGRYPRANQGLESYFTIDSHKGFTQINSRGIASIPNFVGGELVQRTMQWIFDRATVTGQTSNAVTSKPHVSPDHPKVTYQSMDGHGFFFQNHIKALKQLGDWCYNAGTRKITMFFGSDNPGNYNIEVSTLNNLITLDQKSYIYLENLSLKGTNENLIDLEEVTNSKILNCELEFAGINAIDVDRGRYFDTYSNEVSNCKISNTLNNALNLVESTNWTISNNHILNTGTIQGMGLSGDGQYVAIFKAGSNSLIEYNHVENTGYNGIWYTGNNTIVRYNHVHHYCLVKSDGGGIYSYGVTGKNRVIHKNIVHDGPGDLYGVKTNHSNPYSGQVHGIYNDGNTTNVTITENTSFNNAHSGLWFGSNGEMSASGNVLYNNRVAQIKGIDNERLYSNIQINNNVLFAKEKGSLVLSFNIRPNSIQQISSDANYLCRPLWEPDEVNAAYGYSKVPFSWDTYHDGGTVETNYSFYSAENWKKYSKQDKNSKKTPVSISSEEEILFEYNASKMAKTIALNGTYRDVKNNYYTEITLQPYTSIILIRSGSDQKRLPQTISFAPLSDKTFGDAAFALTATATSKLPVTYTIVSGNAKIDGDKLSILGAGSISVEARQNGDDKFSAATPVTQSFSIRKATQNIQFTNPGSKKVENGPFALDAASNCGLNITFRVVSGPAAVNNNTVVLNGAGLVTIEASQKGNENYEPATPVSQSFTAIALVPPPQIYVPVTPAPTTPPSVSCSATGSILREQWNNINGMEVSLIPLNKKPNSSGQIYTLETQNTGSNMGARIRGYICPPQTGKYTFYIAGDDGVELWLSTSDNPSAKIKIAGYSGWTGFRQWTKYPTQKSAAITLEAGKKYYIEVLHKNGGGGDNVSVKWTLPNGVTEMPIPGNRLSPYTSETISKADQTLTFPAIGQKVYGEQFSLNATASSQLAVMYRIVSGNALINGNLVSLTGTGSVTIEATQPGNENINAAKPVVQTFNVIKANQTVAFPNPGDKSLSLGSFTLNASATSGLNVSFRIVSGPATISSNTVKMTAAGKILVEASQAGNANFNAATATQSITITAPNVAPTCSATGTILREQWDRAFGTEVSQIPVNTSPSSTRLITVLETQNTGSNMGARIRGYICPPETGKYTFYIAGDDGVELWLSTSDNPLNKKKIAGYSGWTGFRQWTKYPSQKSVEISLVAGAKYYIEVLHKNGGGGDNVSVKWTLPSGVSEAPIPGTRLSPYHATNSKPAARTLATIEETPAMTMAPVLPAQPSSTVISLKAYPNPFNSLAKLQVNSPTEVNATIDLFDLQGKMVKRLFVGKLAIGSREFAITSEGLASGTYIVKLNANATISNLKIVLLK